MQGPTRDVSGVVAELRRSERPQVVTPADGALWALGQAEGTWGATLWENK